MTQFEKAIQEPVTCDICGECGELKHRDKDGPGLCEQYVSFRWEDEKACSLFKAGSGGKGN